MLPKMLTSWPTRHKQWQNMITPTLLPFSPCAAGVVPKDAHTLPWIAAAACFEAPWLSQPCCTLRAVALCFFTRTDAHKLALHGSEPAKQWLQQNVLGPWKRAGAGTATTTATSSSGGGSSPCMAAGFCFRSLLLHGPAGAGKTELVHALAAEVGCSLLYVPGGESLLKTYQQEGHRLLRALFTVSFWLCHLGC
jgi:hypothetical protein